MGVVGRYILTPSIFRHLRALQPGAGGEYQLTDGIAQLMRSEAVLSYQFEGKRHDCGTKQGYLQATVEFALKHAEVKGEFLRFLQRLAITEGFGKQHADVSEIIAIR
jgi:UTP--glucose-1-phosphate uridylyltransferase